jgi:hypothetical protein
MLKIKDNFSIARRYASLKYKLGNKVPNIITSSGIVRVNDNNQLIFISIVGPDYDENTPNAMMTARMGYTNAFNGKGIPSLTIGIHQIRSVLEKHPNSICMIFGSDYIYLNEMQLSALKKHPHFVWVDPWFTDSNAFFRSHGLNPTVWTWSKSHRKKILKSNPTFVYTATVPSGLGFFEEWSNHGLDVVSLPLACDKTVYDKHSAGTIENKFIKYAFVGGYWTSKGKQIDKYLRPFEKDLHVYGYSPWPYSGYRGMLSRKGEVDLYQNAMVCPAINEPSVSLLKGQINERVFKVLGCGGCSVVDVVPAYRELFSTDELIVPNSLQEFIDAMHELVSNESFRNTYSEMGYKAVRNRHTYDNRVGIALEKIWEDSRNDPRNRKIHHAEI